MLLDDIATLLTQIVMISFIILGTIGNVLNLFIFTRPTLLRSTCTLYLLAASIDNILVIYTSLLTRLLANGFSFDIATLSDLLCKLRYYVDFIFLALSPYFYILACFDRYCSSSASATHRSWSNRKVAKRLIIGTIILASVLYLHIAIFYELQSTGSDVSCTSQASAYGTFYRIFYLVIYCILPSVCMGVLCTLTILNMRRQSRRIAPILVATSVSHHRLDQQMIRILFSQILTQLLCILPYAILSLLTLFINTNTDIYSFFNQILILPLYVSYATSFYVSTMSSRVYRQELLKITWFRKRRVDRREFSIKTVTTGAIVRPKMKTTANEAV